VSIYNKISFSAYYFIGDNMEELLLGLNLSDRVIYLSIMLIVIGEGLKGLEFVKKYMVIWILLLFSVLINFVFNGITFNTLFEAFTATAFATFAYNLIKSVKKRNELKRKEKNI